MSEIIIQMPEPDQQRYLDNDGFVDRRTVSKVDKQILKQGIAISIGVNQPEPKIEKR